MKIIRITPPIGSVLCIVLFFCSNLPVKPIAEASDNPQNKAVQDQSRQTKLNTVSGKDQDRATEATSIKIASTIASSKAKENKKLSTNNQKKSDAANSESEAQEDDVYRHKQGAAAIPENVEEAQLDEEVEERPTEETQLASESPEEGQSESGRQEPAEAEFDLFIQADVLWRQLLKNPKNPESSASWFFKSPDKSKSTVPDIPLYTNRRIEGFIRIYTNGKRYVFDKAIERSATYLRMIRRIFHEHGIPQNLAYLAVVESNFNPNARSRANAVGLWQFMSYTGRSFGLERSWWHDERYDPEKSTIAAARYLKHLHKAFNGDWELAMAAYNSGSGTVRRALRQAKAKGKPQNFWSLKLPRETRGYVPAFYAVAAIFEDLEKYGFSPAPQLNEAPPKKTLDVAGGIPLQEIAEALQIDYKTIKDLNPSIRLGGLTPAANDTYQINIPQNTVISDKQFSQLDTLKKQRYKSWKIHTVRPGETLWSISRVYRIPVEKIKRFNRFRRRNLIRIGQKLMLPVPNSYSPPVVYSKTKIIKKELDKLPGITWVHTVRKGDTLWRISKIYKVPLKKIKRWNRPVLQRRALSIGTEIVLKLPLPEIKSQI